MKPKSLTSRQLSGLLTLGLAIAASSHSAFAAAFTWDGGTDANLNWSDGENWVGDTAPGATGNTLTFAGSAGLAAVNDTVTTLTSNAITFAAGAGSFNLSGSEVTVGGGSNDVIITQASANNQTIALNLKLAGGQKDRQIVMSGGGSLTLSGNIDFANDWLFPTTSAGTIILSGNNSGDGKGGVLVSGTNSSRAMMRNNVSGTVLVLGSDTALGNSGTGDIAAGTANLRGMVANQNMSITTSGGARNLAGSTLMINTAKVTFDGADNLTIGNIINQGGNRDFWVTNTGKVTVGSGLALSNDQTGRSLYLNISSAGGMVVDGKVHDTFHSGGVTTGTSTLRKAGSGTLTLNGDSTYTGVTQIEAGTLKLGHANALGSAAGATAVSSGATLDLNGQTTAEVFSVLDGAGVGGNGAIINSNTGAAAAITSDITNMNDFAIGGEGDIDLTRVNRNGVRTVTKVGSGTLTLSGTEHNNLIQWNVEAGTVVLAKTVGGKNAVDRTLTINGGTVREGAGGHQIGNGVDIHLNAGGTLDMNGLNDAIGGLNDGGSGGIVTNGSATGATIYVGGSSSGSSSGSFSGVIQDGAGVLSLTKEGSGTQTLTGANTYTGATTVSGGTLAIGSTGSIDDSSGVVLNGGNFNVSAVSGFTLGAGQSLTGSGSVTGDMAIHGNLAIGASPGTIAFDNDLSLGIGSTSDFEFTLPTFTLGSHDLALGGDGTQSVTFGGTLNLLFDAGETYVNGSMVQIFDFESYGSSFDSVNFSGLGAGQSATFDASTGFVTVVPEPAAALLGGLGMLSLLRRRRN